MDTDSQVGAQQRDLSQMDRVHINGVSAQGYHGVLTAERAQGQLFRVDVTLYLDTATAAQTDDLAYTVNYAHVCDALVSVIEGPEVNLIETLAERLAAIVLESELVYAVDVTVHKPQAPIAVAFDDVSIQIQRSRTNMPRVSRPFAASQIQPVATLPRWSAEEPTPPTLPAVDAEPVFVADYAEGLVSASARPIPELDEVLMTAQETQPVVEELPVVEVGAISESEPANPPTSVFGVVDAAAMAAAVTVTQANEVAPSWSDVIGTPVVTPEVAGLDETQVRPVQSVFSRVTEPTSSPLVETPFAPVTQSAPQVAPELTAEPAESVVEQLPLLDPVDSPYAPAVDNAAFAPPAPAADLDTAAQESEDLEQVVRAEDASVSQEQFAPSDAEYAAFAPPALDFELAAERIAAQELALPQEPAPQTAMLDAVVENAGIEEAPLEYDALGGNDDVTQILPIITDAGPMHEPELGSSAIIEPSPESLAIYRALRAEVLGTPEQEEATAADALASEGSAEDAVEEVIAPEPDIMDRVPAQPARVVIAIGANLGKPQETLQAAVEALGQIDGFEVAQTGPLARTGSVGGPEDQPDYFNTVIIGYSTLSPRQLLGQTQRIENEHGRVREERWGPRTLDLDIIDFEGVIAATEDLELPHPRANQRAFVLVPWEVLDPEAHLPGLGGGPVAALAATAPDRAGIRWVALEWLAQ